MMLREFGFKGLSGLEFSVWGVGGLGFTLMFSVSGRRVGL